MKELLLGGIPITDFTPLAELSGLKKLNAHGNPIPQEQQETIDKYLPHCAIYL